MVPLLLINYIPSLTIDGVDEQLLNRTPQGTHPQTTIAIQIQLREALVRPVHRECQMQNEKLDGGCLRGQHASPAGVLVCEVL